MEQFWRQIRIQRAKIHKTSLVRSPAQGTFFLWACVIDTPLWMQSIPFNNPWNPNEFCKAL